MSTALRFPLTKVDVKSITFDWMEGLTEICEMYSGKTFLSFEDADRCLRDLASYAPEGGGYNKVGFTVKWVDEEDYEGRFDLTRDHLVAPGPLLQTHMREFIDFHCGDLCPSHMTQEDYEAYLARHDDTAKKYDHATRADFIDFRARYSY